MMKFYRFGAQIGRNFRFGLLGMSVWLLLLSSVAGVAAVCAAAAQEPSPASPQSPTNSYLLQPGDSIEVFYRLTPEYNQVASILPDGYIDLRLLGAIHVGGLNVAEAHEAIMAEANKRLKNPEISVSVVDFVPAHFMVIGEVAKPGRFELRGPTTAVDALAIAGGFTTNSSRTKVIFVRPIEPGSGYGHAILLNFKDLNRLDPSATTTLPVLRNGDLLIVTTSKMAKVENLIRSINFGLYYNPLGSI